MHFNNHIKTDIVSSHSVNDIIQFSKYISIMSCNNFYFENYIRDMVIPFSYCDVDVVGKSAYYIKKDKKIELYNKENMHTIGVNVLKDASIYKTETFINIYNSKNMCDVVNINKFKTYGSDIFNFIQNCTADEYENLCDLLYIKNIKI